MGKVIVLNQRVIVLKQDDAVGRIEECARCGKTNRLIEVGKLWLQPEHEPCGEESLIGKNV